MSEAEALASMLRSNTSLREGGEVARPATPVQTPDRRAPLLQFAGLSAGYFAHIGFFNPYLPLWLQELGFSLIAISLLSSVQSATRLFAPYAWGILSDRTGECVKLLRYGATAALVLSVALWFPLGGVGMFTVLLLMFAHTSAMMPMIEGALANLVSQGGAFDAGRYGRVRLCGSLGFLMAVMGAGWWFQRFGMSHFPAWVGATLVAVVFSAWLLPDQKDPDHSVKTHPDIWPVLRQPVVRWFFSAVFFHVLSHIFVFIFFSLYLDSLGYEKSVIGLLWAVSVLIEIGCFFTQGRWLSKLPLTAWLVLASALMVVRMGLTAGLPLVWPLLLLAQAMHAITFSTHHTVCIAMLSQHFPGRLRGRGQALYTVVGYGLPGVIGGLGGGVLSSNFGLGSVFWLSAVVAMVALGCTCRLRRLQRHPRNRQSRHDQPVGG
ncbi:MFS transporter [Hydrogenophaga crassostreae]|nr:MFS transporter [Hydrogenophaga crassostreae]